jgi:hypothetical protein
MGKIGDLRQALLDLLQEHERDGALPTSARFLYSRRVQRSGLSKERTGAQLLLSSCRPALYFRCSARRAVMRAALH